MESYFNTTLEANKETDNLLYNIINSEDPQQIFMYGTIILIVTFISTKIIYNLNVLIGLIFCSLIIYYLYTYRKYNIISDNEKFKEKFNNLYTKNNILVKYPKIVDFLFYFENFKYKNIESYNELILSFENFCKIYEYCLIDYNLIFTNYQQLVDIKITILNQINNFIFIYENVKYENVLIKQKISAEKIINDLLNNLVILYKKKIYYDGYNNKTINIDYSNVLAYNILDEPNYRKHKEQYNPSNLIMY
jgi:hypothetical protein